MNPGTAETIFTVISIVASIASLVLAVIAIWIALYGKHEAERTNKQTQDLLTEIGSDAKLIAQYAVPELKAYGDSVRRFVFQKGDTETDSASLMSKVENVLAENNKKIGEQLDKIRGAKDITAVRKKLENLEAQLISSQESVRRSVKDSSRKLVVKEHNGELNWHLLFSEWPFFLDFLDKETEYKISNYGVEWYFVDPENGRSIHVEPIKKKLPFTGLGIGLIPRLEIIKRVNP